VPPSPRRGREACHPGGLGRRPPRPAHLASPPARLRVAARAGEGEGGRRSGTARRIAGGCDRRGLRRDRRGGARARTEGQGRHDRQRLRLRRLCGARAPRERSPADHARRPLPRQARSQAVSPGARGLRPRRRRRPFRRRLPGRGPRVRGVARPRRPHRAARRGLPPPLARAAARLRGAAAPPQPLAGGKPERHAALRRMAQASLARRAGRGARRRAQERWVTAAAFTAGRVSVVPRTQERIVTGLFFASLFVATFEKVHWNVAGQIGVNDIATILFLIAYVATERRPLPRTSAIVLAFFAAFALVYLAGFWNIDTHQGLTH